VSGKLLSGVQVMIVSMPSLFKKRLEIAVVQYGKSWTTMMERADKTLTRHDGLFYFLDLPDGKYGLSASLSRPGMRYGQAEETASVARDATGGIAKPVFMDLVLHPTVLKGRITGTGHKSGIAMAEVRVKGSGEHTFSDAQGQYLLPGIEPGKRTVLVFAKGYRDISHAVTIAKAGDSQTMNFVLTKESN
jgi:hypothetical protein